MNNGKVRIYELSRELNLDNKDILAICDQLNIAVKSHSSTISESEAERIRTSAEKYSAQPANPAKKVGSHEKVAKPSSPTPQLSNKPNQPQKQQILQVKHHTGLDSNAKQPGNKLATPPQQPVKPQSASSAPMKQPTTLNRPMRPNKQDDTSQLELEETQVYLEEPATQSLLPEQTLEAPTPPQQETTVKPIASAPLVEKPQEKLAPKPIQPPTPQVERPVLKKAKPEQPAPEGKTAKLDSKPAGKRTAEGAPEKRAAVPNKAASDLQKPQRKSSETKVSVPSAGDGKRPPGERKAVTSLQPRPQAIPPRNLEKDRRATNEATDSDIDVIDNDGGSTTEVLELKRPTPPRLAKPRKEWVREEEEDSEIANKNNKAGAKAKRRNVIIEDDEDFEDELKELSPTVSVSLSVARPPKPKGARPAVAATPTAATAKKKPEQKRGEKETTRRTEQKSQAPTRPEKIVLTGNLTVRELAHILVVPETEIIKKLFFKGLAVNITQTLDIPTCTTVAEELGTLVETEAEKSEAIKVTEMLDERDIENLQRRPPVVTIMGHVDHGKTTLLDAIRATKVAQGEAGGITQHIGAYHVDVEHDGRQEQVVFLDTPGHEAFTAMRARGARVTDIAVLVVAADDGVRPQTIEAISHAKAAQVPIVVAINKTDKPEAQPDRVKQELTEYQLVPEEWGGDTIMVPVSAIQKENLDTLLEMILLVAEIQELQANPHRPAKGTVIEAHLDKAKGPTATLLIQNGSLGVGDTLVAGSVFGKVRAMMDDRGQRVETSGPSSAVEVLGLSAVPAAGDEFEVFINEKEARALADERTQKQRESRLLVGGQVTLNTLSQQAQKGELKELNLVLKADVQGSVEAIIGSLRQLPQNEVQIRMLLAAPGEITETDVDLASASGAVIIGFNTTLASGARQAADEAGIDVREYNIIYKLLDDIQGAMEGLLEPEMVEEPLGQVEVRAVFPVGRGAVAGCYVQSGKVIRNCRVRIKRGGKVIHETILDSLKRMKDDVKEVNSGFECGIHVDKFNDWQEGDIIEAYQMVSKRRTLTPA